MSEFDRHRLTLIDKDNEDEEWEAELCSYLKMKPGKITKFTDIVEWWSVCNSFVNLGGALLTPKPHQKNHHRFPTLARIALDVLPSQASSVACERLFSGSKQTATDRRARLGAIRFEQLQMLKSAWRGSVVDIAKLNSQEIEVVTDEEMLPFIELLQEDSDSASWENEMGDLLLSDRATGDFFAFN